MSGEPHGDRDAHRVDDHRRGVARQQADTEHSSSRAGGPDPVKQGERDHRERGDHEVDPRAGFLNQKQPLAREVSLSRDHRKRSAGHEVNRLRSRAQDPPQVVHARIGVVALQPPGNQRHERQHTEFGLHWLAEADQPPPRLRRSAEASAKAEASAPRAAMRRRVRRRCVEPSRAKATAHTQTSPGSGPLVTPTARSDTPSGSGSGWSTSLRSHPWCGARPRAPR